MLIWLKSLVRKRALAHLVTLEGSKFCERFNLLNGKLFRIPFNLDWDNEHSLYKVISIENADEWSYVARPNRVITTYSEGVKKGFEILAEKYYLNQIDLADGDTVIDCGANIGGLGKAIQMLNKRIRYIAFEPSAIEALSCDLNNRKALDTTVVREGLWNERTELTFYDKNETGDSSVIPVSGYGGTTTIHTTTLDIFVKSNEIGEIKLLKLEAEGAEPEVLDGASEVLKQIEWISADCGPERGLEKQFTIKEVIIALQRHSFELVELLPKRAIALFRNQNR